MTTSTFKFDLGALNTQMATRTNGQEFLEQVLSALEHHQRVEIDFSHRSPTPSFADQCIGGFVRLYGFEAFKTRLKLTNVADDARPLLKHIIFTRASQPRTVELV
jgi:hypothetical protein